MVDLRVNLSGVPLKNPVIAASGTFGYGREFASYYDINCLGALSFKGTTLQPRLGNPLPRIAECPSGMLNAVGLQNPGAAHVARVEMPALAEVYAGPVIANISGFSLEEYVQTAQIMDGQPQVRILEVNISCPNVHGGGMAFGTDPAMAAAVTRAVRRAVRKPVYIKLSPNVTDIASIARACEDAGADGLSLINTLLGMRIDIKTRRPVLANGTGGVSGPCVFPVALRMVRSVYEAVRVPILGMGGVSTARDVVEMMLAGATAVQVGAANLADPFACKRILEELPGVLAEMGVSRIGELTGAMRPRDNS